MTRGSRTGTVLVVAHDPMHAARVEAALRSLTGWRIHMGKPRLVRILADEHPEAILVIVLADRETQRALHAIRAWPRRPPIVALTDDRARSSMSAFRTFGLRAALPLRATADELAGAVRAVHAGLLVLHEDALATSPTRSVTPAVTAGAPLTAREREILDMMADGAHNRSMAARLGISRHTVKFHVTSILTKLGAGSRTEAVALALRTGLLAV
jgi:DNA-binding NarL/FixJ family response regulator